MAENEDKKTKDKESKEKSDSKIGIVTWAIMGVVIIILCGSGFFLGRIIAKSAVADVNDPNKETAKKDSIEDLILKDTKETWYYNDLESVVVNPDEPGATRFVRVGLILEISSALDQEKASAIIEAKKPPLVNWLNLYFKSLTLSEMEDDRDIKRILLNIGDAFNEILFPESKPLIKKVLIKEFNIQ